MIFDHFKLHDYVLELRYPAAYSLWDNAGKIGTFLAERFGDLELPSATPNHIAFESREGNYRIEIKLDRMHISAFGKDAQDNDRVTEVSLIIDSILGYIKPKEISRIGNRYDFRYKLDSNEACHEAMYELFKLKKIEKNTFGIKNEKYIPEILFRLEDEDMGCRLHVVPTEQKTNVAMPLGSEGEDLELKESYVKLDIDIYTKKRASTSAFRADGWLENIFHVLRRDTEDLLQFAVRK